MISGKVQGSRPDSSIAGMPKDGESQPSRDHFAVVFRKEIGGNEIPRLFGGE
jgi:hypothetical protein